MLDCTISQFTHVGLYISQFTHVGLYYYPTAISFALPFYILNYQVLKFLSLYIVKNFSTESKCFLYS